jgi:hypothetical protein
MLPLQVVPRQHIRNVAALKKDDLATLDMMLEVSHSLLPFYDLLCRIF